MQAEHSKFTRWLYGAALSRYVDLCARPSLQRVNLALLKFALRARGYNSGHDLAESGELHFIEAFARSKPRFCLDVGANVGRYAQALLDRTEARVLAFDPLPGCYARLLKLSASYAGRLTALNLALGDRNATLPIYCDSDDSTLASLSASGARHSYERCSPAGAFKSMPVEAVTLDTYFERNPEDARTPIDLLKIDAEGYEYQILAGARDTLHSRPPKFVQIEYNVHQMLVGNSLYSLSRLLPDYRVLQLLPRERGWHLVDPLLAENNIFCYSNFVFARSDVSLTC